MSEQLYSTVRNDSRAEYEDRKSVFIGRAKHVTNESEAMEFIKEIKKREVGARHNVYAFVLKDGGTVRSTDDGEPSGSAGLPVLDVIRKNGVCDVCIVVTRYFGGVLLGTGGLVRAYTNAAKLALDAAQIVTYTLYDELRLECSYSEYQRLLPVITSGGAIVDGTDYSDKVILSFAVKCEDTAALIRRISELTNGKLAPEILGTRYDAM